MLKLDLKVVTLESPLFLLLLLLTSRQVPGGAGGTAHHRHYVDLLLCKKKETKGEMSSLAQPCFLTPVVTSSALG